MANQYGGKRPVFDKYIPGGQLVDVSAASISYAACPAQGVLNSVYATISAAVTGSDTTVTVKKISGGTTTTLGTITIAVTGSAAGSTFTGSLTASELDRSMTVGDTLVFDSDGVSSTTAICNFLAVIRES